MDYLDYFGFASEPFGHAPLPRFYYASEQHTNALSRLMHAANAMKGLAVLLGDIGRGKTTLARRMLDSLPENQFEAAMLVIVHKGITPNWLLKRIALQVGVPDPADDKLTILSQLYKRLVQIHQSGRKAVVLIDEAQMLATRELMEEFRGLLNLEVPGHKLISFVFFGLPSLARNLALDPPLAQRVALRCKLGGLSADDTANYVQHRMRLSGGDLDIFTPESLLEVHRRSVGVPRLINTLCDNTLLELFFTRQQHASPEVIAEVAENLTLPEDGGVEETELGEDFDDELPAVDGGPGHDAIVAVVPERGRTGIDSEAAIEQIGFSAEDIAARVAGEAEAESAAEAADEPAAEGFELPSHQPTDTAIPDASVLAPADPEDGEDIEDPLAFLDGEEPVEEAEEADLVSATAAAIEAQEAAGEFAVDVEDIEETAAETAAAEPVEASPAEPAGEEVDAAVVEALAAGDEEGEASARAFASDLDRVEPEAEPEDDWVEVEASDDEEWDDDEVDLGGVDVEVEAKSADPAGEGGDDLAVDVSFVEEEADTVKGAIVLEAAALAEDLDEGFPVEFDEEAAEDVEEEAPTELDEEAAADLNVEVPLDLEDEAPEDAGTEAVVDLAEPIELEEEAEAEAPLNLDEEAAVDLEVPIDLDEEAVPIDLDEEAAVDLDVEIPLEEDHEAFPTTGDADTEQGEVPEEEAEGIELPDVFDEEIEKPAAAEPAAEEEEAEGIELPDVFDEVIEKPAAAAPAVAAEADEVIELADVFDEAIEKPAAVSAAPQEEDEAIELAEPTAEDLEALEVEAQEADEAEAAEAEAAAAEAAEAEAAAAEAAEAEAAEAETAEAESAEAAEADEAEAAPAPAAEKRPKTSDFDLGIDLDALTGDLSAKPRTPAEPRQPRPRPATKPRPAANKPDGAKKERRLTTSTGKVIDLGEIDDLLADIK